MLIKLRKMREVFNSVSVGEIYLNDGLKTDHMKKIKGERYLTINGIEMKIYENHF